VAICRAFSPSICFSELQGAKNSAASPTHPKKVVPVTDFFNTHRRLHALCGPPAATRNLPTEIPHFWTADHTLAIDLGQANQARVGVEEILSLRPKHKAR
jgi:hypothetical protein